ncbi:hypothetical protein K502DRAFT_329249 [Neoconidiobolus thromboides FSU 785]|nr:hypothetical protein K502DRAFT_329249 [Neoconidiobolus thromboides FSU 785]
MTFVQKHFEKLLTRIEGLNAIALSDKEGVIIYKAYMKEDFNTILESSSLTSVFLIASEQFNFNNCIINIIAEPKANTGILMDLYSELDSLSKQMFDAIATP